MPTRRPTARHRVPAGRTREQDQSTSVVPPTTPGQNQGMEARSAPMIATPVAMAPAAPPVGFSDVLPDLPTRGRMVAETSSTHQATRLDTTAVRRSSHRRTTMKTVPASATCTRLIPTTSGVANSIPTPESIQPRPPRSTRLMVRNV